MDTGATRLQNDTASARLWNNTTVTQLPDVTAATRLHKNTAVTPSVVTRLQNGLAAKSGVPSGTVSFSPALQRWETEPKTRGVP